MLFESRKVANLFQKIKENSNVNENIKIKLNRKQNNISKNEFSKLTEISTRAIADWFNGKKTVSKESYEKIKGLL